MQRYLHDLPGDPDLENPDDEELEDYEDSDESSESEDEYNNES